MGLRSRGLLKLLFFFAVIFLLIRLFPLVARLVESAALSIRGFWWVILIFTLGGLAAWVLRRRG